MCDKGYSSCPVCVCVCPFSLFCLIALLGVQREHIALTTIYHMCTLAMCSVNSIVKTSLSVPTGTPSPSFLAGHLPVDIQVPRLPRQSVY